MLLRIAVVISFLFLCFRTLVTAQALTSSNLPIMVIDVGENTYIGDEPKTFAGMGIIHNVSGERNSVVDPFNNYKGYIGIERRGSSSMMFPKNQYGMELWTANGTDTSASLLDLPVEEDWILFAPYNDKTLMRDVLAYKLARDLGRYAPRTKYFELIIDDEYLGLYVLIEKIKRDKNRVDISKLDPDENSGDDVTGGYILKIDKFSGNGGEGFLSRIKPVGSTQNQQIFFQYDYPEPEVITVEQQRYIKQFIEEFEFALSGVGYDDPQQGYRAYIDVESFIDFMIINEVSKNVDGYRLSTYLHKDRNTNGGKLKMGPVWDFNLGFGNADYCTSGEPTGFVYEFNSVCPDDFFQVPVWWKKLLVDSYFRKALKERWNYLRAEKFKTSRIHAYIDSVATALDESQQRNFTKWPVLGQWIWPNLYVGNTYEEEVSQLKYWVKTRMEWLDRQWDDDLVTGIGQVDELKLSVHPNPSSSEWVVSSTLNAAAQVRYELTDLQGRVFYEMVSFHDRGDIKKIIEGKYLPEGMYILKVTLPGEPASVTRLVKHPAGF
jgi:hypothetical protein